MAERRTPAGISINADDTRSLSLASFVDYLTKNGGPGNPEATKYKRELAWSLLQKHANCWDPGSLNLGATPVAAGSHLVYQIKIETVSGRQALR
jgi:hypothetical protein